MTLSNFLNTYGNNDVVSIEGFCEELDVECIFSKQWYKEIKSRTVKHWQTISKANYPFCCEIIIELK